MDSPLLAAARGGHVGTRSPGLATLKDAFDIAYAVHRVGEEGARRRRYHGRGGPGGNDFLGDLNEEQNEDEDEEDEEDDTEEDARGRARAVQGKAYGQRQQGADGTVARGTQNAVRQGKITTSHRSKGFELDLHGATLLGRRQRQRVGSPLVTGNALTTGIEGMRVREL
jgi:hypothetical protein